MQNNKRRVQVASRIPHQCGKHSPEHISLSGRTQLTHISLADGAKARSNTTTLSRRKVSQQTNWQASFAGEPYEHVHSTAVGGNARVLTRATGTRSLP